jgi:hypothetical protein
LQVHTVPWVVGRKVRKTSWWVSLEPEAWNILLLLLLIISAKETK